MGFEQARVAGHDWRNRPGPPLARTEPEREARFQRVVVANRLGNELLESGADGVGFCQRTGIDAEGEYGHLAAALELADAACGLPAIEPRHV